MKKALAVLAVALLCTATAQADLLITEVVDATLAGGNPKYVEVTNTGPGDYTFSAGGIIIQSNANTDYDVDVDLTGITILAGQSYVIQSSANDGQLVFEATYGFAADLYSPAFFSNGDDRYILTDGTNLLDIHGVDGQDGTGEAWEYLDGYAYRLFPSSSNGGVFVESEWFHGGVNSLEDSGGDDNIETVMIQTLTTPGVWVPEPATLALLAFGGLTLIRRRR